MKSPEEVLLRVVVVVVASLLANFVGISSTMKPSSIVTTLLCGTLYQSDCLLAAKVVGFNVTRALPNNGEAIASLARRDYIAETLNNNRTYAGYRK
jgi:hypothetical protein